MKNERDDFWWAFTIAKIISALVIIIMLCVIALAIKLLIFGW